MQAEQEPHRRAVGVGVPADVQRRELERAHDEEARKAKATPIAEPQADRAKVVPLGGLLGELVRECRLSSRIGVLTVPHSSSGGRRFGGQRSTRVRM